MKRQLCAFGLCLILVGAAVAAEPEKKEPAKRSRKSAPAYATAASPVAIPSASGRKQLEELLETPARLDFGDRKRVTVGEVLDRLHEQHHLSLRFDAPTLASLLAAPPRATPYGCPPGRCAVPMAADSYMPGNPQRAFKLAAERNSRLPPADLPTPLLTYPAATSDDSWDATPRYRVVHGKSRYPAPMFDEDPVAVSAAPVTAAPASAAPAAAPAAPPQATARGVPPAAANPGAARGVVPAPVAPGTPTPSPAVEGPVPTPSAVPSPASDAPLPTSPGGPYSPASPQSSPSPTAAPNSPPSFKEVLAELLKIEIDVQNLDLSRASVATVLRHALDAAPVVGNEDYAGMPILFTNGMLLDYLIEDHGLLITTRMQALTRKETRIYSIKHLSDLAPDEVAKTIRHSIRPWSWRSQINDLGDQLKGSPLPAEMLTSIVKTGVQLAGADFGVSVSPTSVEDGAAAKKSSAEEARQMEMLGNAIANGLVTLAQATVSALEMVHYAEPPTGTIQILGTRLVITQSQAAHREIAELLKQLEE